MKPPSYTRLLAFAEAAIPGILRAHGGGYPKARLRTEIEAGFCEAEGGWCDLLDEIDCNGGRRSHNAIARALANLSRAGLIERTRHCEEVRLKGVNKVRAGRLAGAGGGLGRTGT